MLDTEALMGNTVSVVDSWVSRFVYRGLVCSLFILTALAQPPQQDPIDTAMQAFRQAHNEGRFNDAATHREHAARLLDTMPVGAQHFAGWVRPVMLSYREAGMTARARSIVQNALDR